MSQKHLSGCSIILALVQKLIFCSQILQEKHASGLCLQLPPSLELTLEPTEAELRAEGDGPRGLGPSAALALALAGVRRTKR